MTRLADLGIAAAMPGLAALHPTDAAIIADTHAAADAAEAATVAHARGLASVECLIVASDRAYLAWRRAHDRWAATGDAAMAGAADRARRAHRAADCL